MAYQRVGAAMTQTTLIGGLGLAVFAFSTFTPTQQFGTLMLTLLVAALIGDLIFLPAILAGPLGRAFCPRPSSCPTPAAPAETPPVAAGGGQHSPLARTETPHSPLAHQSNDVVLRPDQRHG